MSQPLTPRQLLDQVEAECKRLDSLGWTLILNLNIRSTLTLASTLALVMQNPIANRGASAQVDRALFEFIVSHLDQSPLLQQVARQYAAIPKPQGASHVPDRI